MAAETATHGTGSGLGTDFILHHIRNSDEIEFLWWKFHVGHPLSLGGLDLSISKHVVMMWLAGLALVLLVRLAFRKPQIAPHGLANFFEMPRLLKSYCPSLIALSISSSTKFFK